MICFNGNYQHLFFESLLLSCLHSSFPPKTNSSMKTWQIVGCGTLLTILILTFLMKLIAEVLLIFNRFVVCFVEKSFVVALLSKTIVNGLQIPNRTLWKILFPIGLSKWWHELRSLAKFFKITVNFVRLHFIQVNLYFDFIYAKCFKQSKFGLNFSVNFKIHFSTHFSIL